MKKSRHHSWLITLPLVGISATYLWLVFLPGQRAIASLKAELADKHAFIASGGNVAKCRVEFERQRDELRAYCEHWKPQRSDSARLAALYGEIAELLKASGVATTNFSPGATAKYDLLQKTNLRIKFEGTFEQVADVLMRLEKMPERLWVEDVDLETLASDAAGTPTAGDQNGQNMRCSVNLVIFAGNSEDSN